MIFLLDYGLIDQQTVDVSVEIPATAVNASITKDVPTTIVPVPSTPITTDPFNPQCVSV